MHPKVSVIMSVYKEPVSEIEIAIDSIIAQTFTNWEMILVIDDPKNEPAKNYLHSLITKEPRIKLLENEKNLGLGASLNRAVTIAQGEYCARMDTEDASQPERLAKQFSYLKKNPTVDLLFAQWREIYPNHTTRLRQPSACDVRNIKKNFFIKSLLLHPTLMIKTEILKKHPYPAMSRPEDWVLFLELIRRGYQFDLMEEVLYEYKVDNREKYQKVRTYSRNLFPHLIKNIRHYWHNPYFWLYTLRIATEYILTRNRFIYEKTSGLFTIIWKKVFRSK